MAEIQKGSNIRKKKENVTITLSPYLKKRLDVMVLSGDFSSLSDLATMALSEFVAKYESEKTSHNSENMKGGKQNTEIIFGKDYVRHDILE